MVMKRMPRPFIEGFVHVQRDMDRLFDGLLMGSKSSMQSAGALWNPLADVCESCEHVVVTFELPGIDRDSIELTYEDDHLIVRGTRRRRQLNQEHSCNRIEIDYGPFVRAIRLESVVDISQAKAHYEDGLLEVTLPKIREPHNQTVKVNID